MLGKTFTCLLKDQFRRLMGGDAYFYSHKTNPYAFTDDQLKAINDYKINKMICDNSGVTQTAKYWYLSEGPNNPKVPCSNYKPLDLTPFRGIKSF